MDRGQQAYWNGGLLFNLKSRIKMRTMKGYRIRVDMVLRQQRPLSWQNSQRMEHQIVNVLDRTDMWTDEPPESLQIAGYKKVTGLYDSIVWWNVPVYLRIRGGEKFDIRHCVDDKGQLIFSQDTSATLHDAMQSNATQAFIKGMGKTQLASMDIQKIFMIGILAVGALFGLYMLGII